VHVQDLIAQGKFDVVAPGTRYPNTPSKKPAGYAHHLEGGPDGTKGVQFNMLDVPGVRADLTSLQALQVDAQTSIKKFFEQHAQH
jgi:hypothetical protein